MTGKSYVTYDRHLCTEDDEAQLIQLIATEQQSMMMPSHADVSYSSTAG